jgi:hypothetical protein
VGWWVGCTGAGHKGVRNQFLCQQVSAVVVLRPTGTFAGFSDRWLLTWLRARILPLDLFLNRSSIPPALIPNQIGTQSTARCGTRLTLPNLRSSTRWAGTSPTSTPTSWRTDHLTRLQLGAPQDSSTSQAPSRLPRCVSCAGIKLANVIVLVWTPTPRPSPFRLFASCVITYHIAFGFKGTLS